MHNEILTVHESSLHHLRVVQLLHEACVLLHAFNAKSLYLRANGYYKIVIGNSAFCY